MGRITVSDTIDAPAEVVFGYVDDHRNTTKYMQGLVKWKPTTNVTHGKRAQFEVGMKAGPTTLTSVVDITTWTAWGTPASSLGGAASIVTHGGRAGETFAAWLRGGRVRERCSSGIRDEPGLPPNLRPACW